MEYIQTGLKDAFRLIASFDPELLQIVSTSLFVSLTATCVASLINVPIFMMIGLRKFSGEKIFSRFLNVLMSTPSVLIGLLLMLILARRGPLGQFHILYTKKAMVIAQIFLVSPIIAALAFDRSRSRGRKFYLLGQTLGAGKIRASFLVIMEMKQDILMIVVTAFSRAISEVGAVMIVGGNIKGQTRVMTTALSMFNSMGDYPMAIAIGATLLVVSLLVNAGTILLRDDE